MGFIRECCGMVSVMVFFFIKQNIVCYVYCFYYLYYFCFDYGVIVYDLVGLLGFQVYGVFMVVKMGVCRYWNGCLFGLG